MAKSGHLLAFTATHPLFILPPGHSKSRVTFYKAQSSIMAASSRWMKVLASALLVPVVTASVITNRFETRFVLF